jgi:hypothetical protein
VRVRNCTGEGFFMDYHSPEGFKSSGEVSLEPWAGEGFVCPYADIALIPGEYRGTAKGEAQVEGVNYTLNSEAGKVYEMNYNGPAAGALQLYIAEIEPDERATTDTGGLDPDDPARTQPEEDIQAASVTAVEETTEMAEAETGEESMAQETTEESMSTSSDASSQEVLPESGQEAPTTAPFAVAAVGLIALMVIGGVFAIKRGKQTA